MLLELYVNADSIISSQSHLPRILYQITPLLDWLLNLKTTFSRYWLSTFTIFYNHVGNCSFYRMLRVPYSSQENLSCYWKSRERIRKRLMEKGVSVNFFLKEGEGLDEPYNFFFKLFENEMWVLKILKYLVTAKDGLMVKSGVFY